MRPFVQLATVLSESQQAVQINRYQQQWDTANAEDPSGARWRPGSAAPKCSNQADLYLTFTDLA
jgi:hypothetical protein